MHGFCGCSHGEEVRAFTGQYRFFFGFGGFEKKKSWEGNPHYIRANGLEKYVPKSYV